jgi:hypothetical protein
MDLVNLLRTVIAGFILVFFSAPSTLLASDFKEKIPIRVQVNIDWTHKGRRTLTRGHFMVNVTGSADLVKKKRDFLKYLPSDMRALCKYKEEETMMDPKDKCFGKVIHRIEGSGSVSFPQEYKSISDGQFIMSVHLGQLGKIAASRYTGNADPESFYEECKDCRDDNYEWMMVVPLKATYQQLCDQPYSKEGMVHASLIVFKELTPEGMHGSYSWNSDGEGHHTGRVHIMDFHGTRRFGPPEGEGAHYRVSWVFGEVKPVVQIWCERKNITDQKSKDVLIGQKVKLEAVVKPQGMSLDKGSWEIEGDIIAGWEATEDSAKLIPFKDHDKKEIKFCWVEGNFTGAPMKVKYSGKADGKTVDATTTINVFKPVVTKIKARPSKHITVGYPLNPPCELFLGKTPANVTPGILITSEIKMPVLPADKGVERPHLLQYVQRIKEEVLLHHNVNFFHEVNDEWCCDEKYPYGGEANRAPYRLEMNDTPGSDIGELTKELHHRDEFDTCLMFIPSANAHDNECSWVPLKVVKWGWAGAVKLDKEMSPNLPCNASTYRFLYKVRPRAKIQDCSTHPVWSCNIKKNKRKIIGIEDHNDEKWKELKEEMEKKKAK